MYLKKIISLMVIALLITSCNKNSDDDDGEVQGDFGSVTFYKNDPFPCNTISISLTNSSGDVLSGELGGNAVVPGIPECDVPNTFTFLNVPYGVYTFSYTCDTLPVSGGLGVNTDCFVVLMLN